MGSIRESAAGTVDAIQLPVIDISQLTVEAGKALVCAATMYGFLYVNPTGTEFTSSTVDRAFARSKEFFASPAAEKARFPIDTTNRGWAGTDNETLDPQNQRRADFKEVFNIGEFDADGKLEQPLPAIFERTTDELREFHGLCEHTVHRILDLIGLGLEVEEDNFFSKRHTRPSASTLRMLYYPALPHDEVWDDAVDVRAGAHSDYGSLTLLFQRVGQPGLEIRTPSDDSWAPVPVIPEGYQHGEELPPILVNIADLMTYWTNGLLKSTVHRVIFPRGGNRGEDRYSIVYFAHPANETELVSVPSRIVREQGDIEDGVEVGYGGGSSTKRAMTAREHFTNRIQATYSFRKEVEASN